MKNKVCVVLIHGFGGGIDEVLYLYEMLKNNGYDCEIANIAGHSGKYMDFFRTKRSEWIESVKKYCQKLLENYDSLILVGFSMGGLISTYLVDLPVKALIFANTPMEFCDVTQIIKNIREGFWKSAEKYLISTVKTPLTALMELCLLLKETKKDKLEKIKCPCLILQSKDDDTANYKSAEIISKSLKCTNRIIYYEKGGHKVFANESKKQASLDVLRFIELTD